MILSFEFHYNANNGVLENLLQCICEDFVIVYAIKRTGVLVRLDVQASQEQLMDFSDFLAQRLPLSVFFNASIVQGVLQMQEHTQIEKCNLVLPFTPKTLQNAQGNPFFANEIGINPYEKVERLLLRDKVGKTLAKADDTTSFESLFENVATLLDAGKSVAICSASGDFVYTKVDVSTKKRVGQLDDILATDLSVVEKMVVIYDNEIKALASLEKPSLRLRLNSLYEAKEILQTTRVNLSLPKDMVIYLLCVALMNRGIGFLAMEHLGGENFDVQLRCDGIITKIPQLCVSVLENGVIIIRDGDGYANANLKENLKKFEHRAYAQFSSILQEHNLFAQPSICFYHSKTHDDMIMHFNDAIGLVELVKFSIQFSNIQEIFDAISSSATGKKMVANYKEQFASIYANAANTQLHALPQNIYSMWGVLAVILGIAQSVEQGSMAVMENAEDFGGDRGPRIDYFRNDENALLSQFNFVAFVRSAMSFKLAGAQKMVLSFGIVEAMSFFIGDLSDYFVQKLNAKDILLAGSLFGSKRFTTLTCKNVGANHQIRFNKELPIDCP
ncbi:MAG: hypothetical protein IBX44_01745 [Sulfurospirillum sp.]|nr:hypothetical protein [Sulfurospirillum sp.]